MPPPSDPVAGTGFFLHPASPLHDTGWGHPEHQGRLRALASSVGKDRLALDGFVAQFEGAECTEKDLTRVHTAAHVERIRAAVERAREIFGPNIPDVACFSQLCEFCL